MTRYPPYAFAVPLLFVAQGALADLTPAQVWGDWRTYMESFGYQIDATESAQGDDLSVSGINLNFPLPEDGGTINMALGTIAFNQNSDGTVAVVLPTIMPLTVSGTDIETGEPFTMTLNYSQTDHAMTASGSPDQLTYLYTAGTVAVDLLEMQAGGETLTRDQFRLGVIGTNLSSTTTMTIGEMRGYEQTSSVQDVSYDIRFDVPEEQTKGTIAGNISGVALTGTGAIPTQGVDPADMAAMLAAGFSVDGSIAYAAGSSTFDMEDPENGAYVMQTSSQGGDLGVTMGPGGLTYGGAQRALNVGVTVAGMPFPFEMSMADAGFNLALPLTKSDASQDFAFGINLGDFTMSDMIWGIFDPAAQLPRDPATILIDLSGKAKLLVDWLNPEAVEAFNGNPGELEAVNLNGLLVSAAGATLEGSGAVTLDGAGPSLIPGVGNPVGDVNLALSGGNGLLDKLVAMGLLPQEQASGARLMMGLFAVPGDAPDTMSSKIEFTADGQILANGQRIR